MLNFQNLYILDKHSDFLLNKIKKENIFIVGGAIRDILLGLEDDPDDIDITTDGEPQKIYDNIDKNDIHIFKTDKFGTITVLPKDKSYQYELTPLRQEGQYDDFRHPSEINWTTDILEDAKRRDFSINCVYYTKLKVQSSKKKEDMNFLESEDKLLTKLNKHGYMLLADKGVLILQNHDLIKKIFPDSNVNYDNLNKFLDDIEYSYLDDSLSTFDFQHLSVLVDPYQGIQDFFEKKIKAVDEPDNRFQEDALRIIRAVRIVNILNQKMLQNQVIPDDPYEIIQQKEAIFDFEKETRKSMKKNYFLVNFIAKERIKDEILKVFHKDNPFGFVSLLDELNILQYLFPYVNRTKNDHQPTRFHSFDTYAHTILSLNGVQSINSNYLVKFAALYHDVGKPDQYYFIRIGLDEQERKKLHGSYIYHPNIGEEFTREDFKRLGFSKKEIDEICFYVKYHMAPGEIMDAKIANLPKKLKKWMSEYGYEKINNLIDLAIGDRIGQYNSLQPANISGLYALKKILKEIYNSQGEFGMKDMDINGEIIMEKLNISPGPQVGKLLKKALEWVIENPQERNFQDKILKYLSEN